MLKTPTFGNTQTDIGYGRTKLLQKNINMNRVTLTVTEMKMKNTSFYEMLLNELLGFIDKHKTEIENAQKLILTQTNQHYSTMKILDMYFWQIGYDKEVREKPRKSLR
ncbi:MAG: hypothetical protein U0T31_10250 [Chitinophagales bacterium]